jgi:hypothetical protein
MTDEAYQARFLELSEWARGEMAKLGPRSRIHDEKIGQLWLIIDELIRRLAKAETERADA